MLSDGSTGPDSSARRSSSDRSVAGLLAELADETGVLVRQEIALFKAEIQENLGRLEIGAGALIAGGLIAFTGWLALIAAAILGLSLMLAPWLAALIVGAVMIALGAGLLLFSKSRLRSETLVPRRTLGSLRQDRAWIRDQIFNAGPRRESL
jgi:Putative Actinobacterial Holin-X, holin superfamily III